MQRLMMQQLLKWKDKKDRKPLIIKGVRQCGKTYLLKQFGQTAYSDVVYFNFEGNKALAERFEQDLDPKRIILELGILAKKPIKPNETLIIFDEIQFCNSALTSLKYFCEDAPQYHIACAGSLLGITLSKPLSFPVGKVDFLTLKPLNFYEFVLAHNEQMLLDYLTSYDTKKAIPQMFADKLIGYLKSYYITGGMPEVVAKWIDTSNVNEIEVIQQRILDSYELDFAKHAPLVDVPKLSLIWNSIPNQLAKENGKFIYGHVKSGARAKDLEDAMQWLINAGLVYKVNKIEKPSIPLSAYANSAYFKFYSVDVGLLRKIARLDASYILTENELYKEFKGALAENYVLQELVNDDNDIPFYWTSGNTAEVDFIAQIKGQIIPIEVKSGQNIRSRSLSVYCERYNPTIAVKISTLNVSTNDIVMNIPLYMLWRLREYIN